MQPVRPKMKKIILAGFVACMSLFGSSSGAPVPRHRAAHPAESNTASLPASSPLASAPGSSPTTTTTRSATAAGANGPTTSSRNPSSSSSSSPPPPSSSPSSRGSPTASPPRPSSTSFSLGLNLGLGQFDYAAAGIARRVSRVFVKRMSAGSSRSMGSARSTQVVQVVQKGGGEEGDRTATTAMTTNLGPVVEAGSTSSLNFVEEEEEEERGRVPVPVDGGQLDNEGHNTEHTESGMLRSTKESESESGEMVAPDIRACRWGCI